MRVDSGYAELNNARLYYELAGAGMPVVLLHGFALDTRMWDDQFALLAEQYLVVRYDLRGFGRSSLPEGAYSHSTDLKALLDYLGITRTALIGLSKGGGIAINCAIEHPALVHALLPVDTLLDGYRWREASTSWVWRRAREEGIEAGKAAWLTHPFVEPAMHQPALAARLRQIVHDYSGWHFVHANPEQIPDPPADQRLGEIHVPTLVVVGERDLPDFQRMAELVAGGVPGAQLLVLPAAGHLASMEVPELFNTAVLRFLASMPV